MLPTMHGVVGEPATRGAVSRPHAHVAGRYLSRHLFSQATYESRASVIRRGGS
ncbi:hypothetical protein NGA_0362200 [Nannochloropsis gaditana CCMP526]|uniref:uncharacterized protein n=1 Tax=Nannochloropsis gaditana (strain CCMP526) TaxID=1093141 RepID=UPI00029F72B2|nr:hypothetical protein NGA_0362200 [Nannochloropsis gaditana CCMP526]EKU21654.1 hypothetical protein NGA_0362200 [Nannochloropsis gaditana CCMP526]|eukprot:XP_005854705.1 hypothetical protein NGA_0362200 [Nannochloropsis gaditana CCMP526]